MQNPLETTLEKVQACSQFHEKGHLQFEFVAQLKYKSFEVRCARPSLLRVAIFPSMISMATLAPANMKTTHALGLVLVVAPFTVELKANSLLAGC